jgi:anti-anti-sigma factor
MSLFASHSAELHGDVRVVHLAGEIDLANAARHGDALRQVIDENRGGTVVVNCAHLEFIDSRGLAMMYRVAAYARSAETRVVWRGLSRHQRRLFELTGLTRLLSLEPSVDEADDH